MLPSLNKNMYCSVYIVAFENNSTSKVRFTIPWMLHSVHKHSSQLKLNWQLTLKLFDAPPYAISKDFEINTFQV